MRLAIISDIHGNLEAFQQVLEDARVCGADLMVSLGDNVGYGADSQAVVELLREHEIPSVLGNHELALINPQVLSWFNPQAREVILKVGEQLSEDSLSWINSLPDHLVQEGCRLVHGFPPNSVTKYMFECSESEISQVLRDLDEEITFCGHTHQLDLMFLVQDDLERVGFSRKKIQLDAGVRVLANAGSVGQPRDNDPYAKYLIYDRDQFSLEARFVAYDIPAAQAKIKALGFPSYFASRLGEPEWDLPLSGQAE